MPRSGSVDRVSGPLGGDRRCWESDGPGHERRSGDRPTGSWPARDGSTPSRPAEGLAGREVPLQPPMRDLGPEYWHRTGRRPESCMAAMACRPKPHASSAAVSIASSTVVSPAAAVGLGLASPGCCCRCCCRPCTRPGVTHQRDGAGRPCFVRSVEPACDWPTITTRVGWWCPARSLVYIIGGGIIPPVVPRIVRLVVMAERRVWGFVAATPSRAVHGARTPPYSPAPDNPRAYRAFGACASLSGIPVDGAVCRHPILELGWVATVNWVVGAAQPDQQRYRCQGGSDHPR